MDLHFKTNNVFKYKPVLGDLNSTESLFLHGLFSLMHSLFIAENMHSNSLNNQLTFSTLAFSINADREYKLHFMYLFPRVKTILPYFFLVSMLYNSINFK